MLLHDIPKERSGLPLELKNFIENQLETHMYLRFRIYMNRPATLAPSLPYTVMFLHRGDEESEDEMWDTTWENNRHRTPSDGFTYDPSRVEIIYD